MNLARLLAGPKGQSDAGISALIAFLVEPSQNTKASAAKQ